MQMEAFVQIAYYERSSSLLTYGLLRGFFMAEKRRFSFSTSSIWGVRS